DCASGEQMVYAIELAAHVLHARGCRREVTMLVGAVEAVNLRFPRGIEWIRSLPWRAGVTQPASGAGLTSLASLVPPELDEHRVAGQRLSLESAADLALRVLDEELSDAL